MAIYLVDSENMTFTNSDGEFLIDLMVKDTVYIFANESTLSGLVLKYSELVVLGYDIRFIRTSNGFSNALDFQLVLMLGRLSATHPDETFYIVSNDKSFKALLHLANTLKLNLGVWDSDFAKAYCNRSKEQRKKEEKEMLGISSESGESVESNESQVANNVISNKEFKKMCDTWDIIPCDYFRSWSEKTLLSISRNKKYDVIVKWLLGRGLDSRLAKTVYFTIASGGFKMNGETVKRLAVTLKMPRVAILKLNMFLLQQTKSKYGNPVILNCETLPK